MSGPRARQSILDAVRGALDVKGDDTARKHTVQKRLKSPRANLVPERAKATGNARLKLFTEMLEGQSARVSRATNTIIASTGTPRQAVPMKNGA